MPTSLPERPRLGTGELIVHVDRVLDEGHPTKPAELDQDPAPTDPIEKIKALIFNKQKP